jgi:hypothetical protein
MNTDASSSNLRQPNSVAVTSAAASASDPMPILTWMLVSKLLGPIHIEPQPHSVDVFNWSPALWDEVEIRAGQRKVKPVVRPTRGQLMSTQAAAQAAALAAKASSVGEFGL